MMEKSIPESIRKQVDETVNHFNQQVIKGPIYFYTTRYEDNFLYLDRTSRGVSLPICRLKYTGIMGEWEFAIYMYNTQRYNPDEKLFSGSGNVDGTVEGALRAGLEAYP